MEPSTTTVAATPPPLTVPASTGAPVPPTAPEVVVPPPIVPSPEQLAAASSTSVVEETTASTSTTTTVAQSTTTTSIVIGVFDDLSEEVSIDDQPPPFKPVLPPLSISLPRNIELEKALAKLSAQQKRIVDEAQKQADAATERIAVAQRELDALQIREDDLRAQRLRLTQKKEATAIKIRARALRIYAGEGVADLDLLLRSEDFFFS